MALSAVASEAIATWFGCGRVPKGPGTAGSAGALVVAIPLLEFAGWQPWFLLVLSAVALPAAVWAAHAQAVRSGEKDPGCVVIDEVVGQWITLGGATAYNWKSGILAFILFRAFDIWKPPPVRMLERLPGGFGIVADDVMAGVYGALVLFGAGCFNLY